MRSVWVSVTRPFVGVNRVTSILLLVGEGVKSFFAILRVAPRISSLSPS